MSRAKSDRTHHKGLRPGAIAIALGLALFSALGARAADPCPELTPWIEALDRAENPAQTPRSLAEGVAAWDAERKGRVKAAEAVFEGYLSGSMRFDRIDACLAEQRHAGDFLNTLQSVFYSRSLERLRASHSPSIRWFLGILDGKYGPGQIPLFRVTGHFRQDSPEVYKAGFHRGSGSVYMDLNRIPPGEWTILLIHELLHGLDPLLSDSIEKYGDTEFVQKMAARSAAVQEVSMLNARERAAFSQWIQAGLGRGLWAEYRAWVPTLVIYAEGRRENLWPAVDWLDQILDSRPTNLPLASHLYSILDSRSADPDTGIFANPLFQSALRSERASARKNPEKVPLGLMGTVLVGRTNDAKP